MNLQAGHRRRLFVSLLILWIAFAPVPLAAGEALPAAPAEAIAKLFSQADYPDAWFAPSFRTKLAPDRLAEIVADLKAEHGALESIERRRKGYLVRLNKAALPTEISFDAKGRIASLRFKKAEPEFRDIAAARAAFAALPGTAALLVRKGEAEPLAMNAKLRLSVGSAFKLAVLAAIEDAVTAKRLAWDQVVSLKDGWRSLPTGILQDWPTGQKLTLESLAGLMISLSDNTAADALLALAGRPAVEALAPGNAPFLDTRSFFVLKAPVNQELRTRYEAADATGRLALLAEAGGRPLPAPAEVAEVVTPKVGWFFSLQELCGLMGRVAHLPALHINPGLATPQAWTSVAFKGGGDAGVLNLTSELVTKKGVRRCVAATWNDDASLDRGRFFALYGALLRLLRDGG